MSIQSFIFIIISCQLILRALSGKCPPRQVSYPCICSYQTIRCEGNETFVLKNIFQNISEILNKNEKSFDFFLLNNTSIERLDNNSFADLTFRYISIINAKKLNTIDSDAFNGTHNTVEVFEQTGDTNLENPTQLLESISKLTNVLSITLNIPALESLPSNILYKLNRLQELTLTNGQLNHISATSFHFELSSNQSLIIDFSNNNLNEYSFDVNSLKHIKRPLELDLRDNQITALMEEVFRPFLLSELKTSINLSANPLNCSDCRNRWLVEDEHLLEDSVIEARCAHFVSVFELELNHFKHCLN